MLLAAQRDELQRCLLGCQRLRRVTADLGDLRAWKYLLSLPRLLFGPVDRLAQKNGTSVSAQIKERCCVVLEGALPRRGTRTIGKPLAVRRPSAAPRTP